MGDRDGPEHAGTVAPALADTQAGSGGHTSSPTLNLTRGAAIGRYIVVDQLAAGGMGTVYAAYDPELDRKVAIKVLRSAGVGTEQVAGRARMMREAQATARLSHPNVVAVYDVGPIGEQVFIAMELVDGATLASWLTVAKRPLAEILDIFMQAGRGLAAAHRAGLVHRDFKPENVLVGKDGRARVADFGLVRGVDTPEDLDATPETSNSMLSVALTQVGTIMGTPRYMAPEQRARRPADARADQYSFCVSLYEALNGRLPADDAGPTAPVADAELPAALVRAPAHARTAIQRGLAEDPAQRWPSMDPLLAELARDPCATRRRWLTGGGIAVAAAGVAIAVGFAVYGRAHVDACAGAEARLADVWAPSQRAAIERAFKATDAPYAVAAFGTISQELDGYARAWRRSYEDSCRATHERHEQSAELLDLRSVCLSKRRNELAALVELLGHADAKLVRDSVTAAASLPAIADCDDIAALQAPTRLPSDSEKRHAIESAQTESAKIDALYSAGRYSDALPRAHALHDFAHTLGYQPIEAEAAFLLGLIEERSGDQPAATQTYAAAFTAAINGHDDGTAARAATAIAVMATDTAQLARGETWATVADALVTRLGDPPEPRARLYRARAHMLSIAGKEGDAAVQYEHERDLLERTDPGSLELGRAYLGLEYSYDQIGRFADARAAGERALAIEQAKLGPDHPEIALVLNNLGNIAQDEGAPDAARGFYERALAIRERSVAKAGDDPRGIAMVANNLGMLAIDAGRYDEALDYLHRAVEIRQRADPEDPVITLPMGSIATVFQKRHQYADALALYEKSLVMVERKLGKEHPFGGDALVGIGNCKRELGKLDESQAALERALAIRRTDSRPTELGEAQWELAQTLWARGEHPRAVELAKAARAGYATSKSKLAAQTVAEIDAWLRGKS
jgi:tetratricopeptide (TPR) repeat protein